MEREAKETKHEALLREWGAGGGGEHRRRYGGDRSGRVSAQDQWGVQRVAAMGVCGYVISSIV